MRPVALSPNQPRQFYRGGSALSAFRGTPETDGYRPEDWIGSTTARHGTTSGVGLSALPDGTLLRDAIRADPTGWLGSAHAAALGDDPALLVKLLDAGERLPIHVHPDRVFSQRHFDCRFGKTEAWVVIAAAGSDARVHLGFRRDVGSAELDNWMATRDAGAMLENLHALDVHAGDVVLVPARMPHAIGAGVFCLELQEPTDYSVMLEWEGFDQLDPSDAHLGLDPRLAQECVQREALDRERIQWLRSSRKDALASVPGVEQLFHEDADPFFRAQRIRTADGPVALAASYAIVVVLEGKGHLDGGDGCTLALQRGSTVLVPHGAGETVLSGSLVALRCMPPSIPAVAADGLGNQLRGTHPRSAQRAGDA
jgi:mannose-6-phosphate isomerase